MHRMYEMNAVASLNTICDRLESDTDFESIKIVEKDLIPAAKDSRLIHITEKCFFILTFNR